MLVFSLSGLGTGDQCQLHRDINSGHLIRDAFLSFDRVRDRGCPLPARRRRPRTLRRCLPLSLCVCVCVSGPEDLLSMMMKVEPGSCLYLSWPAALPLHVVLQGCESVQS